MSEHPSRAFTRVPVHIRAFVEVENGPELECVVHDLSMTGVSIETGIEVEVGRQASVTLLLETGAEPLKISTRGEVSRVAPDQTAFSFTSIHGDDYEHLEKLVLFNAPDAGLAERELVEHADEQPPLEGSVAEF